MAGKLFGSGDIDGDTAFAKINPLRARMSAPLMETEILTAIALLFFVFEIGGGDRWSVAIQIGRVLVTLTYVFLNVASALFNFDPTAAVSIVLTCVAVLIVDRTEGLRF